MDRYMDHNYSFNHKNHFFSYVLVTQFNQVKTLLEVVIYKKSTDNFFLTD